MSNLKTTAEYYFKDAPKDSYAYKVEIGADGNEFFSYIFSGELDVPTLNELENLENDALIWKNKSRSISYQDLYRLLPRHIRAKTVILMETLKSSSNDTEKFQGYVLGELLSEIVSGNMVYNKGIQEQVEQFNVIKDMFVSASILTEEQATKWANLEVVS